MIELLNPSVSAAVDLSQVTFTYNLPTTPGSGSGNFNLQLFLQRASDGGYEAIVPRDDKSAPLTLPVFGSGAVNTGSFTVPLKPDTYGAGKAVLFAKGSNFGDPSPVEFGVNPNAVVTSTHTRITKPVITEEPAVVNADGTVTIPYTISYPADPRLFDPGDSGVLPYGGFLFMLKGDVTENKGAPYKWYTTGQGGNPQMFSQVDRDGDTFWTVSDSMTLTPTASKGLKNLQAGLFNQNYSQSFQWVWPGDTFAVGQWEVLADPAKYPSLTDALAKPASFPSLGGNFGNYIVYGAPANDASEYFSLLAGLGMKFIRVNYDPDQYLNNSVYPGIVDQVAQHILMAGLVPCLAPQNLPYGSTLAKSEDRLVDLAGKVAARYVGVPLIQDVLNEPSQYGTWADWKPVAARVVAAIKAVNPSATIVVGGEGYSKDLRGASADPLPEGSVWAYCIHPYGASPADIALLCGTRLPVWVQEYDDGSAALHAAFAALPNVLALSAWAWTTPGQDSLSLVQSVDGAALTLTPTGQAIADIYQAWRSGAALPVDAKPTAPATAPTPPAVSPSLTADDVVKIVQPLLDALKADILAVVVAASQDHLIADSSFEAVPAPGGQYVYCPTGSAWRFTGCSGVQANGSDWHGTDAPDGTQTAFLQGRADLGAGKIEQSITITEESVYCLTLQAARRYWQQQPLKFCVDGNQVGDLIVVDTNAFVQVKTSSFPLGAGRHTVSLEATDISSDNSVFVDAVSLVKVS